MATNKLQKLRFVMLTIGSILEYPISIALSYKGGAYEQQHFWETLIK